MREHSVRRDRAQCSFLGEEVRPDSADGAAGEESAESTGDERPGRFNHCFEHFRPVEIQFHFGFPFFLGEPRKTRKDFSVCSVYSVVYNFRRFDNRLGGAFPARLADEDAVFSGDVVAVGGFIRLEVGLYMER